VGHRGNTRCIHCLKAFELRKEIVELGGQVLDFVIRQRKTR
jgi:hypothetical protein